MGKNQQKIFRQQIARMKSRVTSAAERCPVCAQPIDPRASTQLGHGETIWIETLYGRKSVQRFADVVCRPCGCAATIDRRDGSITNVREGGKA